MYIAPGVHDNTRGEGEFWQETYFRRISGNINFYLLKACIHCKVSVTPIQSNWVICSRNKRSKEVSGTCVQCMQGLKWHGSCDL